MVEKHQSKADVEKATDIVRDAGGKIVGRTRLQKIGYLLEAAGLGDGFKFQYHHYGPYSEELAAAVRSASLLGLLDEQEYVASWGGVYSVFKVSSQSNSASPRAELARLAADADPVELELAATAAFLGAEGSDDPWDETANRKPEKAEGGRLEKAKVLYMKLCQISTPRPLPAIF